MQAVNVNLLLCHCNFVIISSGIYERLHNYVKKYDIHEGEQLCHTKEMQCIGSAIQFLIENFKQE